tara:strand:+ start:207 stop:1004 length:798 start_codon:yes stop_codon:yes gene_type:complete
MVRQLSPISEENKGWFEEFLNRVNWEFISPDEIWPKPHSLTEPDIISLACHAGRELEDILNQIKPPPPVYFEVYNPKSDHLRISDFKKKKEIAGKVRSALKWMKKDISPIKKLPSGTVEIGHVFDEYLKQVIEQIPEDSKWSQGSRVEFSCEELGLRIGGTTDLDYDGVPVEMKTRPELPRPGKPSFRALWSQSYLPQIAMYSEACGLDWMFLLLISRESGEFSLIPVSGKAKLAKLKKDWEGLSRNRKLMQDIEKYRKQSDSSS